MTNAFFFALYGGWGLIWLHVLFYYGRFAHCEWDKAGGTVRGLPREIGRLTRFIFAPIVADVWAVLRRRPLPADTAGPYHYTKGHRIGFFIALAAFAYTLMGMSYSIYPDRSQWPLLELELRFVLVTLTSIAGLGHLFTALEHKPRRWRWFIVVMFAWYPLSMWAFLAVTT